MLLLIPAPRDWLANTGVIMLQEEVSTAQVRAALHQAADGGCPVEGLQPVQPPQQSTPGPPAHDAGAQRLP